MINLFTEAVIQDNGSISKEYIKQIISNDEDKKKALENYFFPLVKKAIKEFKEKNKEDKAIFVEVPLMFESRINLLMDFIIGIDASLTSQLNHLQIRNSKTPSLDIKLNSSNKFDKYISKCDYIIHNNSSLEDLKKNADEALEYFFNK